MDAGLGIVLLKLVIGLVIVLSLTGGLKAVLRPIQRLFNGGASNVAQREVTQPQASGERGPPKRSRTADEARQSKGKAEDAARALQGSTPGM